MRVPWLADTQPKNAVLVAPSREASIALLGLDCDASAVDLEAGACYCIRSLGAPKPIKCMDIPYSSVPTSEFHIVGSAIDALAALIKRFGNREIRFLHLDPLSEILNELGMQSATLIKDALRVYAYLSENELDKVVEAARRAARIVKEFVSRGGIDSRSLEQCTISLNNNVIEATCREGYLISYVASSMSTDARALDRALGKALKNLSSPSTMSSILNSLYTTCANMGLELLHVDAFLLGVPLDRILSSLALEKLGIEPPTGIGLKLYAKRGSEVLVLGATIAIYPEWRIRVVTPWSLGDGDER